MFGKIVGALVAGALMLSTGPSAPPARGAERARSIESLLERRAHAVKSGDRAAFLDTVGPRGSRFYRSQALWFDRVQRVGFEGYSVTIDEGAYGDLARPSDVARYPGADLVMIPLTVERYRIAGADRKPVVQDAFYTFVERAGSWRIESDDDLDDLGFFTQRNVWDFGAPVISRSPHFVGIAGACGGCPNLDGVLDVAETARDRVRPWAPGPVKDRLVIVAPQGTAELAQIIQATFPVDNYVAFAFWTGSEGEPLGTRLIVNPSGFSGASYERALSILTHELFHAASLPVSGPHGPRFLEEGYAQYAQYDGDAAVVAAAGAGSDGRLPQDHEFFVSDGSRVLGAYREALSAVGFLARRFGVDALRRFYVALGKTGYQPGTSRFHVDRAMRRTLGVGVQRFEDLWASSLGL